MSGILVPLYILVAGFDPKQAVALSNLTIFGSAISNVALAAARRHPHHDKPLIDWSMIMIMEPPVIAGAVIGSLVSYHCLCGLGLVDAIESRPNWLAFTLFVR